MKKLIYLLLLQSCIHPNHKELNESEIVETKSNLQKNELIQDKRKSIKKYINHDSIMHFISKIKDTIKTPIKGEPFNALTFNKVVAFEYYGEYDNCFVIENKNQFVEKITALTQQQVYELCQILSNKKSYGNGIASCFDPHLCFSFFDDKKVVMEISIFMSCNHLKSTVAIPSISNNKLIGFSITTQNKLKKLCKALGYKSYDFVFN